VTKERDDFGKECQATGRTVTTLVLQMAEEAAVGGMVPLAELQRIIQAVDGMGLIFEMSKSRCIRESRCRGVTHRRNRLLGRIIAQPLEDLLLATPPVLERRLLSPLFDAISQMVGEPLFSSLEQKARTVYFSLLASDMEQFDWPPFYESNDSISCYCQLMVLLSTAFRTYGTAKQRFIALMRERVEQFGEAEYFQLMRGVTRPLLREGGNSRYRTYLEGALLLSERRLIDGFISALEADHRGWRGASQGGQGVPRRRRFRIPGAL
jgi:hypothetical protein